MCALEDKASSVRRYAVALLAKLILTHPYGLMHGGLLRLEEWASRYTAVSKELKDAESKAIEGETVNGEKADGDGKEETDDEDRIEEDKMETDTETDAQINDDEDTEDHLR